MKNLLKQTRVRSINLVDDIIIIEETPNLIGKIIGGKKVTKKYLFKDIDGNSGYIWWDIDEKKKLKSKYLDKIIMDAKHNKKGVI